jgi:hypothetical protein
MRGEARALCKAQQPEREIGDGVAGGEEGGNSTLLGWINEGFAARAWRNLGSLPVIHHPPGHKWPPGPLQAARWLLGEGWLLRREGKKSNGRGTVWRGSDATVIK